MNSLRLRILFPLWLFGFLPAMGATRMMGQPLDWFFGITGVLLGGGVFLAAYLISGWLLKPTTAVMKGTTAVLRGVPPDAHSAEWLPADFWKLRCDINMIFAKQRQALNAAEQHACQTAQRLLNAERLLREAFTALQGLFAASDEGVLVVDAQGSIIASNAKLDDFLGKQVEEVAGRDASRLLSSLTERFAEQAVITAWIEKTASSLDGQDETPPLVANDGRVFSLRSNPMRTDAGEIIGRIWIVKDRSEMRVLETQLRESQKMGTIGQLAGGIAHDFNNLLTAIRGNLTLAELTPASNQAGVRDKLQNANHATTRAAELVKSLLGYSRRSTGVSASARPPISSACSPTCRTSSSTASIHASPTRCAAAWTPPTSPRTPPRSSRSCSISASMPAMPCPADKASSKSPSKTSPIASLPSQVHRGLRLRHARRA
jgi:two-component system cell cycle sensor histidine kinase/response regulator CckA